MSNLKVVALISGGKDSLFSILHCVANGHDIVALANLYPPAQQDGTSPEDTDSFMYQTVGHAVIPLYQDALGLPLYRQEIQGSAVNQSKSYGPKAAGDTTGPDETESLTTLLRSVLVSHPEINAVSTGAILSDYQRTRVESVAIRLELAPLSYLWQYPYLPPNEPISLLADMSAVGQDARIIKVASGGLDESFLWQNVASRSTQARLIQASQRFGSSGDGSVLGEGGEYETLAIAGPPPLWKAKIVVEDTDREFLPGEAGSAAVRIARARIEPIESQRPLNTRIPELLDHRSRKLLGTLLETNDGTTPKNSRINKSEAKHTQSNRDILLIGSVTGKGQSAVEQTTDIMRQIEEALKFSAHSISDIVYTSIVLRDMADFAAVNTVYGRCFTQPNPPSRATLACADVLPDQALVTISVTSVRSPTVIARKGLHVQSRSYWAPANIGPYSQAITVHTHSGHDIVSPGIVYVAGQIPLVPASMELYCPSDPDLEDSFSHQAVLALQHLYRIGTAVEVKTWTNVIAFITASSTEAARARASVAKRIWSIAHQAAEHEVEDNEGTDDDDFDIWDQQYGHGRAAWQRPVSTVVSAAAPGDPAIPPITVINVDSLPRSASIEWVAYGSTEHNENEQAIPHLAHLLRLFSGRIL